MIIIVERVARVSLAKYGNGEMFQSARPENLSAHVFPVSVQMIRSYVGDSRFHSHHPLQCGPGIIDKINDHVHCCLWRERGVMTVYWFDSDRGLFCIPPAANTVKATAVLFTDD